MFFSTKKFDANRPSYIPIYNQVIDEKKQTISQTVKVI